MGHGPDLSSPVRSSTQPALSLVGSGLRAAAIGGDQVQHRPATCHGTQSNSVADGSHLRAPFSMLVRSRNGGLAWGQRCSSSAREEGEQCVSVSPIGQCPRGPQRLIPVGTTHPHTPPSGPTHGKARRPPCCCGSTNPLILGAVIGATTRAAPVHLHPPGESIGAMSHVYPPADRPEADVLVDGTWFVGELRMWSHVRMGPGRLT